MEDPGIQYELGNTINFDDMYDAYGETLEIFRSSNLGSFGGAFSLQKASVYLRHFNDLLEQHCARFDSDDIEELVDLKTKIMKGYKRATEHAMVGNHSDKTARLEALKIACK